MAYDYGYGDLENQLIELLRTGAPDFEAAEELIRQGADINAIGKNDDENILSEILSGYWWSKHGSDTVDDLCADCYQSRCSDCDRNQGCNWNPDLGPSMCAIIRFFLDHGFDVNKCDGCFGAQCLGALTFSTFDRYMIEATKLLLNAGARNRTVSPSNQEETPWDLVATEGSYQDTCEGNHALGNLFEAVYQIYQAIEDGKPYGGIDSYEAAVGKKILTVLAKNDGAGPIFFKRGLFKTGQKNWYTKTLYFVYDSGVLISTQYVDFWTDTIFPATNLVDVSKHFKGIVGSTIKSFTYGHRSITKGTTRYGQPITTIEMDSGCKVRLSTNFGEVEKEACAAYYEILDS